MVNLIDVVIIAIALIAALGALLLLRPQVDHRSMQKIRKMLHKAEQDQKTITQILNTVEFGAKDAEYLSRQLKSRVEQVNTENKTSQSRAETAEVTINKAKAAEKELRQISQQLGERIQHTQTYWNDQLEDTTGNIKKIKANLNQGLTRVDEGLLRLQEQEKIAQGFTHKLLQHQKEHLASQQKNTLISGEVHTQMDSILKESTASMRFIQEHQQQIDDLFNNYSGGIRKLEKQANEQFTEVFQSTDMARQEMNAGLQENSQILEKLREHETQSTRMHDRIKEQFSQVDILKVERLGETVELTDEMCVNLQQGLENARALLSTLEAKTAEVIDASEKKTPAIGQGNNHSSDDRSRNLFSLRANR